MALHDPPVDPFADLLGYQLRRLSLLVMSDLAGTLHPLGLRPAEATVLLAIRANPGVTQSELGRMLAIKRANMAPLVGRFEARGLIARAAVDGRSQALTLTTEGQAMAEAAGQETHANEERCFSGISDAERAALARRLRAIWSAVDQAAAQAG